MFVAASLRGEPQKVLTGMSDNDYRSYSKIVDKLELRFCVEGQRELYQARLHSRRQQGNESIQALAADIGSMAKLARKICLLILKKDLPLSIPLMLSKIKTKGFDCAGVNQTPWTKSCRLVNWRHLVF